MKNTHTSFFFVAAAALLVITGSTKASSTFFMSDITTWIGPAAGPGIIQAAVVIDWDDGQPSWAWGYRWDAAQPLTGAGLFAAIQGADSRLGAVLGTTGSAYGIRDITWNSSERVTPAFNQWKYFLNGIQLTPGSSTSAFTPPAGSPYDDAGPGAWYSPTTLLQYVPVVDGSWNGFRAVPNPVSGVSPALPISALPVPEPSRLWLLSALVLLRRKQL
jgi:hypothetical protein